MSSSSKSKSKDKRAGKEQKVSSKASGTVNGTAGISASAYNPVLGTFHTLEALPAASSLISTLHVNGRFRNIDETDDISGSMHESGGDYDSASNNDSRSVESEEHKAGATVRQVVIPGADNDKREKIRQKNERKHQRQKEKRSQELHERSSGYLMTRKLDSLVQQLVGMGFSQEQATRALILNEGRIQEAVTWLFEGGEEEGKHKDQNVDTVGNLKIDISEELARISEIEVRCSCSKQDVERAIVACEGDLVKAEETLLAQKQDPLNLSSKPEGTGDPISMSNGKISLAINQNPMRLQQRPTTASIIHPRKDDKEFNYTKAAGPTPKIMNKSVQATTKIQPKLDWARPQQMAMPADKRLPSGASAAPSVSYSMASPLQMPSPAIKTESRYVPIAAASEYKNVHPGTTVITDSMVMRQKPQSVNSKLLAPINTFIASSPPSAPLSWYPSSSETIKPNGLLPFISTRSISPNDPTSNHQMYQQTQYHHQQQQQFMPGTSPVDLQGASRAQSLWKRAGSSPTLAVASSLGLFSGMGSACSSGSTSPVDWHTGSSMSACDYNNIDWSLDRSFLPSMSKPTNNGFWQGLGPSLQPKSSTQNIYDSNASTMGTARQAMRPPSSNGNGVSIAGFTDGASVNTNKSSAGSREWTSAFEGNDLFSLPRQFVSSTSP